MANVIWKAFKLGDLFQRKTPPNTGKPAKELTIYEENDGSRIALVTRGEKNNGVVGYIEKNDFQTAKNKIIYNDQFGTILFHNYEFTTIKDHLSILEPIDGLLSVLEQNMHSYVFITKLINKIFDKQIFNFNYSAADFKFPREVILLPVIEIKEGNSFIWKENGKFWILAVDYIKELMNKAKERKEAKTIKLIELEKSKYEVEKSKYEAKYLQEHTSLIWKAFRLGDLFQESTEHYLEKSKKHYEINPFKNDEFPVAVCAASKNNNGIVGYIQEVDDVPIKKRKGYLTKGGFGHVFYQQQWFIKPGGSWGMLNILKVKHQTLKHILDTNIHGYYFIAGLLTKIFTSMSSWGYAMPLEREIVLLPVKEVTRNDEYVWEEQGKFWTFAVNTASYLYLQGQITSFQRKIDNYSYQY